MTTSTLRLRAASGSRLDDPRVWSTVQATAHAIAERTGVPLISVGAEPDAVVVSLAADTLAAVGFLAELRRVTNAWYAGRFGGRTLWDTPGHE